MKKIILSIIVIFMILCYLLFLPSKVEATVTWSDIKGDGDQFIGVGLGQERKADVSNLVNTAANILTTIGVIVVLGGILITGIKYMTASPQEAAKLKSRLIGLVIAGLIILGAFAIWKFIGGLFESSVGTPKPITVKIPVDIEITPTP